MIELRELDDYFKQLLKPETFEDVCPNGLQIEGKKNLHRIGFAVSANLATIQLAIKKEIDALICHHGLFWHNESYCITGSKREKISLLLEKEISCFCYHLPLDAHQEVGNNWVAASELGWQNLQPFGKYKKQMIGVKGMLPQVPIEVLIRELETYYQHPAQVALGGPKKVTVCALVSGGAWRSIQEAVEQNVDCFITGNVDEPAWSYAFEEKIHFLSLGHSATETIGPKALCQRVKEDLPVQAEFIDVINPF